MLLQEKEDTYSEGDEEEAQESSKGEEAVMDLLQKSEVKTEQRAIVEKEDLKPDDEDEEESEYEEVSVEEDESEEVAEKPTAVTEGKAIPSTQVVKASEPQTDLQKLI